MADVGERVATNEANVESLQKSDKDQWAAIRLLQNRLPVWATLLISVLTFALGCSLTYARLAA